MVAPKGRDVLVVVENTDAAVNDEILGIVSWPIPIAIERILREGVRAQNQERMPYPDEKMNLDNFPLCMEVARKLKWSKDIAATDGDVYTHELMTCWKVVTNGEWTSRGASPERVETLTKSLEDILEKLNLPLLDEVQGAEEAGAKIREAYQRVPVDTTPKAPDSTKHPYCMELYRLIKDEEEWSQFIELFFSLYLPNSPGMTKMATEAKMRLMAYNLHWRRG